MSKKIALSIAEPCHENWEKMSPVEKGRFCGSCQKQVIDFSNMSDRQVAEFFKKPSTGSVCGRFMTDQLNREIEIPKKRIPWVRYFFQFALPAFLVSLKATAGKTQGETKIKTEIKDTTRIPMNNEIRTLGMVLPKTIEPFVKDTTITPTLITDTKEIKGKVTTQTGEPVPYASVQVGKIMNTYVADEKGEFIISSKQLADNKTLLVSSVGFETKVVSLENSTRMLNVVLTPISLGEVTLTSSQCYTKGKVVAGAVSVIKSENIDEVVQRDVPVNSNQKKFFVFPNPVFPGGNISLGVGLMEEGYYAVQFITMSGQILQQKEIWIDSEARVLNLEVPKVAVGSYFLVLTNNKTNKKMTEKIIIQ